MPNTIAQKLRVKDDLVLLTINAPDNFRRDMKGIPPSVQIVSNGKKYDQIHWFVHNRAQLEKEMSRVMKLIKGDVVVWVYYPKGSSGMQTDLTRDKGWDCFLAQSDKLAWINLISFNDTWSVFGFRAKNEADRQKDTKPKIEREIFKWVDPATKKVTLPDDVALALKKNKKEGSYFDSLAFSHKKEYLEWIVTAKREETRAERIKGMIERLAKSWKNPRNI